MMNSHTSAAAAAALLGAAHHFYPAASVADAVNATMAQQYYATQVGQEEEQRSAWDWRQLDAACYPGPVRETRAWLACE